jgi:prophage antirepressor-like protein
VKELQIFEKSEFGKIRMVEIEGKPYAVGVDVARALEYASPSKAVIDHCKGITKLGIPSKGGVQETNVIPEGDIIRLITKAADQSKSETVRAKAEKFESWIFDEVIPQVLKTGRYEQKVSYMIPKTFSQALQLAANLQAQIEENAPLVAYAQAVSVGDDCVTVGTVAKIIEQKYHVHIGQNRLFEKMREDGILFKAPKGHKDHNRPTQYYMEAGWFVLRGSSGKTPKGKPWENFTPYVTPKGRIALVNKYGRLVAEQQTTLAYQEG